MNASRKPTGELVREIADDLQSLVRKEVELARVEVVGALSSVVKGAGLIAAAVVACMPGLLFLVVALALALPVSPQLGFLIVGGGLLVLAGVGILIGVRLIRRRRGKITAVDSVKEDVRWAREHLSR